MAMNQWKIHRTPISPGGHIIICDDDTVFLKEFQRELYRILKKININVEIKMYNVPADIPEDVLRSCLMVFFDIDFEKEEENGIAAARRLRSVNKTALLFFVTNYIEYAPEGFEVRAFRYILKRDMTEVLERYMLQAMEQLAEEREYLQLYEQDRTIDIPLKNIRYMEVVNHYVSIYTEERACILNTTLSNFEKELDRHGFLRVHKSYLVNMSFIRKFRSRECVLLDETVIPVGEKNYPEQKQKYLRYKGTQL